MAWQCDITTMVRHLVDDTDEDSPVFSDERIETCVLVAAQLVINEIDFPKTYVINIDGCSITPDPTEDTKDNSFINIVALRSACIILGSALKTQGLSAISVNDGPSSINLSNTIVGIKEVYKEMCQRYEDAKILYNTNGSVGSAVLSPYSPGSDYINSHSDRGIY